MRGKFSSSVAVEENVIRSDFRNLEFLSLLRFDQEFYVVSSCFVYFDLSVFLVACHLYIPGNAVFIMLLHKVFE